MTTQSLSIFIIDDHKVVIDGLTHIIKTDPQLNLIGYATSKHMAVEKLKSIDNFPEIIICDYRLQQATGIELIHELKKVNSRFKFIFLTMVSEPNIIKQCWDTGCSAFLNKNIDAKRLLQTIKSTHSGATYISKEHLNLITFENNKPKKKLISEREKEILTYVKNGYSSKEIASIIHISKRTVDNHRFNLLKRYDCKNTAQLLSKITLEAIA